MRRWVYTVITAKFRFLIEDTRPAKVFLYLAALAWSLAAAASPLDLDGGAVAWSRLTYRSADRPDELSVEVSLSKIAPERLSSLAEAGPDGDPVMPDGAAVWQMTSTIDVRYTGQTYRSEIWFLSQQASPLQRHRDKLGRDANRKTYRYLADGVRRLRIEPEDSAEAERPPDQWSHVREEYFPYGPQRADCPILSDPNLLFLIASAGAVTQADGPLSVCVFNKKSIYRVTLSAGPVEMLEADYGETKSNARTEMRRKAEVRKVRIEAVAPKAGEVEPEPFEFFEMGGVIEIDLDAENGLPLRISGEIAGFGRVAFLLSEVELWP